MENQNGVHEKLDYSASSDLWRKSDWLTDFCGHEKATNLRMHCINYSLLIFIYYLIILFTQIFCSCHFLSLLD